MLIYSTVKFEYGGKDFLVGNENQGAYEKNKFSTTTVISGTHLDNASSNRPTRSFIIVLLTSRANGRAADTMTESARGHGEIAEALAGL